MAEYISKSLAVEELENLRQQYEMHDDCDELVASKCKNAVNISVTICFVVVRIGMRVDGNLKEDHMIFAATVRRR